MKKLRGAVVGVGYLGNFHAQKYKALSSELDFEFVGVCDFNPEQAQKIAEALGTKVIGSLEQLVGLVDFATVATTTPAHFKVAKFLLENGINVNVEKPMTVTVAEGEALLKLAEAQNLHLAVGHSERFSPVFAEIKKRSQSQRHIELQRHAPFKARGAEVSVVLDLMVHDLDLMLSLEAGEPKILQAQMGQMMGGSPDWVRASFLFPSGCTADIFVSRLAPTMTRVLKVIEDKLILIGDFQTGEVQVGLAQNGDQFLYETIAAGKGDNLLLETKNFVRALQGLESLEVTGRDGLRVLALAEKVVAVATQGNVPSLKDRRG